MTITRTVAISFVAAAACSLLMVGEASAKTGHGGRRFASVSQSGSGVSYAPAPRHGGYQPLVSDGYGTGFGFHRNPAPFRLGAAVARDRQRGAVRSAVLSDAIESQPYGYGFYGDSVYGEGSGATWCGWIRLTLFRRLLWTGRWCRLWRVRTRLRELRGRPERRQHRGFGAISSKLGEVAKLRP